jgi:hypothetical protein
MEDEKIERSINKPGIPVRASAWQVRPLAQIEDEDNRQHLWERGGSERECGSKR